MALPFLFANVTTLVTSQLDANYSALGALTPIPCTASGSNAITLTPLANTPTVSAYANYMTFRAVAVLNNTTTATAAVAGLAALPIYKDTGGSGPVALTGSEIVANCEFAIIYDSALNSGNGGFHLDTITLGSSTLSNVVSAAASIGWPAIGATTSTVATLVVTGASVGDCVILGTPASVPAGISFFGWVNNAGTITIQALNVTGGVITPVAGTYRATAQRYTP
jgi:hypothetical protein